MNCAQIQSGELLEEYLLRRLPDERADALELHILECDACFEELRTMQAAQQALRECRRPGGAAPGRRIWALLVAAAALFAIVVWTRQELSARHVAAKPPPVVRTDALAELARVDPPAYKAPVLRGAGIPNAIPFADAMRMYADGDWAGAAAGLERAEALDPAAPGPPFYLGICRLALGQAEASIPPLERVIALGDTAYRESAQLYLAKAWLQRRDRDRARAALETLAALHGDLEAEARRMLQRLQESDRTP
jgi:tetratricopeptide (TPR) repeat protein